jgi:hypothetical protein
MLIISHVVTCSTYGMLIINAIAILSKHKHIYKRIMIFTMHVVIICTCILYKINIL